MGHSEHLYELHEQNQGEPEDLQKLQATIKSQQETIEKLKGIGNYLVNHWESDPLEYNGPPIGSLFSDLKTLLQSLNK